MPSSSENQPHHTDGTNGKTLIVTAIITALSGVFGVGLASTVAQQTAHGEAEDSRRTQAYSSYLSDMSRFNEFIWGQLSWAGTGAPGSRPADETEFWSRAADQQASLESDYLTASMFTTDSALQADLDRMRLSQQEVWQRFKCQSGASSPVDCPKGEEYELAPHSTVQSDLLQWLQEMEALKASFTSKAREVLD